MSGAMVIGDAMADAATDGIDGIADVAQRVLAHASDARREPDLIAQMQAVARLILAAETLRDHAGAIADAARGSLAHAMSESGAPAVDIETHRVSLVSARQSVVITGPVPEAYMRQPPAVEDKAAILRDLRAGAIVPGAVLSNGGAPALQFRGKK